MLTFALRVRIYTVLRVSELGLNNKKEALRFARYPSLLIEDPRMGKEAPDMTFDRSRYLYNIISYHLSRQKLTRHTVQQVSLDLVYMALRKRQTEGPDSDFRTNQNIRPGFCSSKTVCGTMSLDELCSGTSEELWQAVELCDAAAQQKLSELPDTTERTVRSVEFFLQRTMALLIWEKSGDAQEALMRAEEEAKLSGDEALMGKVQDLYRVISEAQNVGS